MAVAGYGTIQQRASTNTPPADDSHLAASPDDGSRTPKYHLASPFSIPSSTEAAALRIARSLTQYILHYTHFVWIVLFITLIPERKVALIYMVIMTYVASLYLLVLRTFPGSIFLHKFIDKRLVLSLLVIATMVGIIFNGAALHLLVTLAATTSLVLVHASMWIGEDAMVAAAGDKEAADFLPVVQQESQQGSR